MGRFSDRFSFSARILPGMPGPYPVDEDPARATRLMQALMRMVKLDIDALQKARAGA